MKLFPRTLRIVSAALHHGLDKLEKPELLARHALEKVDQAVREATTATARSIAAERLLRQKREEQQRAIDALSTEVAACSKAGDEQQVRRLLGCQFDEQQALALTDAHLADAIRINQQLRVELRRLNQQRKHEQNKIEIQVARHAAAAAASQFAASSSAAAQVGSASGELHQAVEQLERSALVAEAVAELHGQTAEGRDSCNSSERARYIDEELNKLRAAAGG